MLAAQPLAYLPVPQRLPVNCASALRHVRGLGCWKLVAVNVELRASSHCGQCRASLACSQGVPLLPPISYLSHAAFRAGPTARCSKALLQCQHLYAHWFKFWLLRFESSSLIMCLGKQQMVAQVLGLLYPCGRPGRSCWMGSAPATSSILGVSQEIKDLSLVFFLSSKIKKSFKNTAGK